MQKIIPAILTADSADLEKKLAMLKNHTSWVQIDIMDGKFVSNTSVNLFELGEASQFFNLEIHLMVVNPEKYFEDCAAMGAKRVIFHLEGTKDPNRVVREMMKHPFQRGIAINPSTLARELKPYLSTVDSALVLSVTPGFQGQEFLPLALEKINEIKLFSRDIQVGVDGGINESNIREAFQAGADYVAVGSGIWQAEDPIAALQHLEEVV